MYDNILYPTDGSEGADAARTHAQNLAETYDATVHILHVVNESYLGYESKDGPLIGRKAEKGRSGMAGGQSDGKNRSGMVGGDPNDLEREHRERCDSIVNAVAEKFGDAKTENVIRVGKPHDIIIRYAEANDIDLIVMGTQGRTGVNRYLLGSVTEKVVRLSDVPVVTVRKDQDVDGAEGEADAESTA